MKIIDNIKELFSKQEQKQPTIHNLPKEEKVANYLGLSKDCNKNSEFPLAIIKTLTYKEKFLTFKKDSFHICRISILKGDGVKLIVEGTSAKTSSRAIAKCYIEFMKLKGIKI